MRVAAISVLALTAVGCTGWDVDPVASACAETGETKGAVTTAISFARQVGDDSYDGLDLDGHVSVEGDVAGCFKGDFVGPNGELGIDNQFATLLPLVEEFVGEENIDALLEGAIANGQLLIMLALTGVDDPLNDDCVDFRLGAGLGTPFLDTTGSYEPYQTFGFDEETAPPSSLQRGRIEDGVFTAGPGHVVLPVRILDAAFNLDLQFSHARLKVVRDPIAGGITLEGLVSGGIHVDDFNDIVTSLNIGDDVIGAVVPIVAGLADLGMDEDGICKRVSAALKIQSTPAYLHEP